MKQEETINENVREIIQEYFVKPQLLDSDSEEVRDRQDGLKKVIQKAFVKHQILEFDSIKSLLEDDEDMTALYDAIKERDSHEAASQVFTDAIEEAKHAIASEYGLGPRRKKDYEILAEELEDKYGEDSINKNINNLIGKNIGNSGEVACENGSCGC